MTVACPDCRSVFRVDPAKVPASGVRARCSVCGGIIAISGGTLPVMVTPASAGVVQTAFATPAESTPAVNPMPAPQRPTGPAIAAVATRVPTPTAQPAIAGTRTPVAPSMGTVPPGATAGGVPSFGGASPTMTPPAPMAASAASGPFSASSPTPSAISSSTPGVAPIAGPTVTATHSPASSAAVGSETARRPINPFLKADPGQRARRLARALVSDLVAYHPQKRDEGIRNGTLRQIFREEIKKSYEEYVEQVGREMAESSPHFQEALNDILGGGKKLF